MKASTVYSLQKLSKDRTALLWRGKISVEKKSYNQFSSHVSYNKHYCFSRGFLHFFLPPAYTLPFLGRMVLYLEIFFSLSQHYYITLPRIQRQPPLRNKNQCGTQFHTLLYFFKTLPTTEASIITSVLSPSTLIPLSSQVQTQKSFPTA